MASARISDLQDFYVLLAAIDENVGGARRLASCSGNLRWPGRGVYFFMEDGEVRSDTGSGLRIVRVGTHALIKGAGTKLWTRLSGHRGRVRSGSGNHRGSVFRKKVGEAILDRNGNAHLTWGKGKNAPAETRASEVALECEVSKVIGAMPFLWLAIEDEASPDSLRGYVERNAIALLSNFGKEPLDPPSAEWLGNFSKNERVRLSGLWNDRDVDRPCDREFLMCMERIVADAKRAA
jgi:hypothetical protein